MKTQTALFKIAFLLALTVGTAHAALQGDKGGNGGAIVKLNGKWCLLDIYQSDEGACANPYFEETLPATESTQAFLKMSFKDVSDEVARLFALKVDETKLYSVVFGQAIEGLLKSRKYVVRKTQGDPSNPYFENSPVNYSGLEFMRAALRVEPVIYVSPKAYALLDNKMKAALLFHEFVSATLGETENTDVAREYLSHVFVQGIANAVKDTTLSKTKLGRAYLYAQEQIAKGWYYSPNDNGYWVNDAITLEYYSGGSFRTFGLKEINLEAVQSLSEHLCSTAGATLDRLLITSDNGLNEMQHFDFSQQKYDFKFGGNKYAYWNLLFDYTGKADLSPELCAAGYYHHLKDVFSL